MLAAYEAALKQGAKDESEWNRTRGKLYAPPRVPLNRPARSARKSQAPAEGPGSRGLELVDVNALLARVAADEARYGG